MGRFILSVYPFSAVVGLDNYKLALILTAINPAIGGVLVSGPRGVAKSTLARSCAALLVKNELTDREFVNDGLSNTEQMTAKFVTLPLGATEEMLIGSLDVEGILHEQQVKFKPGLLAKAHQGILYVDEVNLLPDLLVDQLLDVAASGVNIIERDGVSHQHDAQFILLGTMNPDEGELRSQLLDRFGFCVELSNDYSVDERIDIVELREQFEANPEAFNQHYEKTQQELASSIHLACNLLMNVQCSREQQQQISQACVEANVDGLRADIVWARAAKAHAAWRYVNSGNKSQPADLQVKQEDIDAVEHLVLQHRRQHKAPPPPSSPPPFQRPPESKTFPDEKQQNSSQVGGDWGAMQPEQQSIASDFTIAEFKKNEVAVGELNHSVVSAAGSSRNNTAGFLKGGKQVSAQASNSPDWLKTASRFAHDWPPKSLDYKKQKQQSEVVHLVLLDTSASVLMGEAFAKAKAFLLAMAKACYLRREQLSIVGFGNDEVKTLLPQRRAEKNLQQFLENLSAGGGTPFNKMFEFAQAYVSQLRNKSSGLQLFTTIVSDGCSQQLTDKPVDLGFCRFIDIEQSAVKRGKGQQIASRLNAEYYALT